MRILVTGGTGFVGDAVVRRLAERGHAVVVAARHEPSASLAGCVGGVVVADLAEPGAAEALVAGGGFEAVVNAAAVADIRPCEEDPGGARALNAELPGALARACAGAGRRLVHLSTDQVFDGTRPGWTEADEARPLHLYGETKLAGERAVAAVDPGAAIVRAGLVTGVAPEGRRSSTSGLLAALAEGRRPGMFTDEIRSPIAVVDLARAVADLVEDAGAAGLFHAGGDEALSRHALARREARAAGFDADLVGSATRADVGLADSRPADLSLCSDRLVARLGWTPRPLASDRPDL